MKHYLGVVVGLICFHCSAQPILQHGIPLPFGVNVSFGVGGTVNPGAAGANVIWDFSHVSLSNGGTFQRIDPATTPYRDSFPSCTYAIKVSSSITFYNYCNLTDNVFEWVGVRWGSGGNNQNLTPDPAIFVKFPFRFNDKIVDTAKSTDGTVNEVDTLTYDGYGTLITPYATYHNVIRVKQTNAIAGTYDYDWYLTDSNFTYSIFQVDLINNSCRAFRVSPTGIESYSRADNISIFPNPAQGNLCISGIKIGSLNQYSIFNMIGNKVSEGVVETKGIDISNLSAGEYFIRIYSGNVGVVKKFSVLNVR